jgi:hypothetical protein
MRQTLLLRHETVPFQFHKQYRVQNAKVLPAGMNRCLWSSTVRAGLTQLAHYAGDPERCRMILFLFVTN